MDVDFSRVPLKASPGKIYEYSEFELCLSFEEEILGFIFRAGGREYQRKDLTYDTQEIVIG